MATSIPTPGITNDGHTVSGGEVAFDFPNRTAKWLLRNFIEHYALLGCCKLASRNESRVFWCYEYY